MTSEENMEKKNAKGRTTYNNNILTNIVTLAVSEVDGVAPSGGTDGTEVRPENYLQKIKLDFDGDKVYVDLSIYIYEGYNVPDVAFKVQEAAKNGIENMTSFTASSVDVRILGVILKTDKVR